MKLHTFLILLLISGTHFLFSQEKLMTNAYNRETTSLNGYWKYIVDPYENGFYNYRYEPFEEQKNPGKGADSGTRAACGRATQRRPVRTWRGH